MNLRMINGSEFLHVPKTGGSWVTKVLQQQDLVAQTFGGGFEHADFDRMLDFERHQGGKRRKWLKRRLQTPASAPFRFCFVRHPLSWYESWWKYMCSRGWNDWGVQNSARDWHPNSVLNGLGDNDFNTFIQNVIRRRPGCVSELYFAYTKPGVNFIGRMEHLVEDLLQVLTDQALPIDIDAVHQMRPVNKSSGAVEWDPGLRKTVTLLELPALIHFGYLTSAEAHDLGVAIDLPPHPALGKIIACPQPAEA